MTVARPFKAQSLDELRQEIDRIDNSLHELLIRRADVAHAVAEAKQPAGTERSPAQPPAIRAGREAQILRRLLARHHGALPPQVVVRIWREIISSSLQLQTPFHLHVCVGNAQEGFVDLAHAYFGSLTPIRTHARVSLVVHACAEEPSSLGIVPSPDVEEKGEAWWTQLAPAGQPGPRIIARLPFIMTGDNALSAFAIGSVEQEPSGDDTTILRLETTPDLSRTKLTAHLKAAGMAATFMAATRGGRGVPRAMLLAIAGFIAPSDSRLAALRDTVGEAILRTDVIGGYANPVVLNTADGAP